MSPIKNSVLGSTEPLTFLRGHPEFRQLAEAFRPPGHRPTGRSGYRDSTELIPHRASLMGRQKSFPIGCRRVGLVCTAILAASDHLAGVRAAANFRRQKSGSYRKVIRSDGIHSMR